MPQAQQQERPTGRKAQARRPSSSTLLSVSIHIVLGILVWQAVRVPAVFERLLQSSPDTQRTTERVQYVAVPSVAEPSARHPAPLRNPSESPRIAAPSAELVAPREVPTQLPPVPLDRSAGTAPGAPGAGSAPGGALRGGDGPTRGVQPGGNDPRVWAGEPEFIYAPKTEKERLDSALTATLGHYIDSLAASGYVPNKFERGDWTFGSEGNKWGIDQQYIRLGRFSIPTALLALLPLNRMQPNPILMDQQRNAAWMRSDILYHAQAAMNEDQFRQAVKAIRERKERERREARKPSLTNPGPVRSPGERPPGN